MDTFHFRSPLGAPEIQRELAELAGIIGELTENLQALEEDLREKSTTGDTPTVSPEGFSRLVEVRTSQWHGRIVGEAESEAAETTAADVSAAFPQPYGLWSAAGAELAPRWQREAELTVLADYFEQAKELQLAESVYGFFANGGTSCYVLRLDRSKPLAGEIDGDPDTRTGLAGLETVPEVTMVAVPDLWTKETVAAAGAAVMGRIVGHCVKMRNRLALLEPPPGTSPGGLPAFLTNLASPDSDDAAFTTLYYPWLHVPGVDGTPRTVPPSGHIAGVWA
ncbi:hypothetical protein UK12_29060, partial [Saccharothrix sp. ST-888]